MINKMSSNVHSFEPIIKKGKKQRIGGNDNGKT